MDYRDIFADIDVKFTSANDTQVDSVRITREEWELVKFEFAGLQHDFNRHFQMLQQLLNSTVNGVDMLSDDRVVPGIFNGD